MPDSVHALRPIEPSLDERLLNRVENTLERAQRLTCEPDEERAIAPLDYPLPDGFRLSVVIPVYNEEATVARLLQRVEALPLPKELIIVDDGSADGTRQRLRPWRDAPHVQLLYKSRNEGKGAALRLGFAEASGDIVVVQDADLEYDPLDIPALIRPIVAGEADVVYGSRFLGEEPQDPSWLHRLGNRLLTSASNLTTGLRLTDMETCYKAFRRDVLQQFTIQQDRFGFEPEVTAKIARRRLRVAEWPIRYQGRGYAEGKKIGLRDAVNALYCIARYGLAD